MLFDSLQKYITLHNFLLRVGVKSVFRMGDKEYVRIDCVGNPLKPL